MTGSKETKKDRNQQITRVIFDKVTEFFASKDIPCLPDSSIQCFSLSDGRLMNKFIFSASSATFELLITTPGKLKLNEPDHFPGVAHIFWRDFQNTTGKQNEVLKEDFSNLDEMKSHISSFLEKENLKKCFLGETRFLYVPLLHKVARKWIDSYDEEKIVNLLKQFFETDRADVLEIELSQYRFPDYRQEKNRFYLFHTTDSDLSFNISGKDYKMNSNKSEDFLFKTRSLKDKVIEKRTP